MNFIFIKILIMNNHKNTLPAGTQRWWLKKYLKKHGKEPDTYLKSIGVNPTNFNNLLKSVRDSTIERILNSVNSNFSEFSCFIAYKERLESGKGLCEKCIQMLSLSTLFIQFVA